MEGVAEQLDCEFKSTSRTGGGETRPSFLVFSKSDKPFCSTGQTLSVRASDNIDAQSPLSMIAAYTQHTYNAPQEDGGSTLTSPSGRNQPPTTIQEAMEDFRESLKKMLESSDRMITMIVSEMEDAKRGPGIAAMPDDYPIKRRAAAEMLGIANLTLKRWIDRGEVAAMGEGKRQYVTYGEIKRFVSKGKKRSSKSN